MAPKLPEQRHVPLGAREVAIIRRLKSVIKLPVTKIALADDRNKTTVYGALDKTWKSSKKGRPDLLTIARTTTSAWAKACAS
jgi:hypothetical protein